MNLQCLISLTSVQLHFSYRLHTAPKAVPQDQSRALARDYHTPRRLFFCTMSILITGSTGKTGRFIVNLLGNRSVITVSRQPGCSARFDWEDRATYILPFDAAQDIVAVHLIIPAHIPPQDVCELIDLAISKGVKRFVLMSGSLDIPGDPIQGPIRAHLRESDVPFCVLRPSRFFGALIQLRCC